MLQSPVLHPLALRHHKRIGCRSRRLRDAMSNVWVVSWNLRGKSMVRLGTASMMAMSYHRQFDGVRNAIELLCITAATDPADSAVHYSNVRMAHDFSREPYPGAHKRTLDPQDEGTGHWNDRPNGSWVRLALEADRVACRAVEQNWLLPSIPSLPTFYAGFTSWSDIDMELSPAMIRDIAAHMGRPVDAVAAMSQPELTALAAAHWPGLWRAPQTEGNDSGLWLINLAYVPAAMNKTPHLFEDFSGLLGVETWNPIRDIPSVDIQNPTLTCAKEQGIDLQDVLATIAAGSDGDVRVMSCVDVTHNAYTDQTAVEPMTPSRFVSRYDAAVDQLLQLEASVRMALGFYGKGLSNEQLHQFVLNPGTALTVASGQLRTEDAVRVCREHLDATRPLVSVGTTDADLEKAVADPNAPLFASRMCGVQVLYRDPQMDRDAVFYFTPGDLGRDRVYANLWAGEGWTPKHGKVQHRAQTVAVAVE